MLDLCRDSTYRWTIFSFLQQVLRSAQKICANAEKNFSERSATRYALTGNNFHFYVGDEREKQVSWERGELLVD